MSYLCHLELWEEKQAVPTQGVLPWCCYSCCTDSGAAGEGHPNATAGDKPECLVAAMERAELKKALDLTHHHVR